LKHEDTNLASSTLIPDQTPKENLGIIVQYKVRLALAALLIPKENLGIIAQ
jgi:beta-arrestin